VPVCHGREIDTLATVTAARGESPWPRERGHGRAWRDAATSKYPAVFQSGANSEQINVVVRDIGRSLALYRLLGVSIDEVPMTWAPDHVNGVTSNRV